MAGEGAGVVHIPPGVAHFLVLVVTDACLPDVHEVGHTATVCRLRVDGVARTVVQGDITVGVLVDGHIAYRGSVTKTTLASQTLSYGQ